MEHTIFTLISILQFVRHRHVNPLTPSPMMKSLKTMPLKIIMTSLHQLMNHMKNSFQQPVRKLPRLRHNMRRCIYLLTKKMILRINYNNAVSKATCIHSIGEIQTQIIYSDDVRQVNASIWLKRYVNFPIIC